MYLPQTESLAIISLANHAIVLNGANVNAFFSFCNIVKSQLIGIKGELNICPDIDSWS